VASFSNRNSPNYGVQSNGAIHGNVTINAASPESPQDKLRQARRLLASHVPRAAAELIEEIHAQGERTSESSFCYVIALISGKPIHEFRWEQISAAIAATPEQHDRFNAGVRFIDDLLRFGVYPAEAIGNARPSHPMKKFDELPDDVRELIDVHCAILLSGLETATLDKQLTELRVARESPRQSHDPRADRERRVPLFFLHDPATPRITHAAPPVRGIREIGAAVGAGLLLLFGLSRFVEAAVAASSSSAWLALPIGIVGVALALGALVAGRLEGERHLVQLRRFEPLRQPWPQSPPQPGASARQQRFFAHFVSTLYDAVFVAVCPDDEDALERWLQHTAGIRWTLATETTVTYISDEDAVLQPGRLIWRMIHQAEDLLHAWQSEHFFDYRKPRRPTAVKAGQALGVGLGGLAALWALSRLWLGAPGNAGLGVVFVGGALWLLWITWLPWVLRLTGTQALEQIYQLEERDQENNYRRVLKLLRDRPSDEEMAAWLEEDMRYALAHAVWVHHLALQDLHWNVVLNEGAPDSDVARYPGRPARFRHYSVKVFLLTQVGSRHLEIHLDFATGRLGKEVRGNFRYESISMVLVNEMAPAQRDTAAPGQTPDNDPVQPGQQRESTEQTLREASNVVMVGKELTVQLNNATEIAVAASANLLGNEDATLFAHDQREVVRLQEEASGIDTATQILEGVAADGALWFDRARRDSYRTFLDAFHPALHSLQGPSSETSVVDVRALEAGDIDLTSHDSTVPAPRYEQAVDDDRIVEAEVIDEPSSESVQPKEESVSPTFHNENSPNSGVQAAGDISGGVNISGTGNATSGPDFDAATVLMEIRRLRSLIEAELSDGRIDGTDAATAQENVARAEREATKANPDVGILRKSLRIIHTSMEDVAAIAQAATKILHSLGHL